MKATIQRGKSRRPITWLTTALLILWCYLWWSRSHHESAPDGWQIITCDVGQGSATLVRSTNDSAVLVDTGPEQGDLDECLRWARVRRLSAILLSHEHADHIGNLEHARQFLDTKSGQVLCSPAMASSCQPVSTGQQITVGNAELQVLWPHTTNVHRLSTNNSSLILHVEVKPWHAPGTATTPLTALLPGDAESPALDQTPWNDDTPVDILALAHHGSKTSGTTYLEKVSPDITVASTGKNNSYGHPHQVAVQELRKLNIPLLNTADSGHIAFQRTPTGLLTHTQKHP
ncbi:ComEC/Rec2 family competence protein [Rothia sp. LK2588]|uniref:ComEC/Rec2 family competence protein n=1 Tax=Rothia sp. LK2588 TaxID=3114369 RepID=UPI0034CF1C98